MLNCKKRAEDWFNDLPKSIKVKANYNLLHHRSRWYTTYPYNLEQALCNFEWELTEEGGSYWLKVQRDVRNGLYERTDWNAEVDLMQQWFAAYVEMLVIEKLETRNPLQIVREYQETGMLFLHNGFKAVSFSDWKINQIAGQTIYL